MKIAIIIPGLAGGGTEQVATILGNELFRQGHSCSLICCYGDEIQYEILTGVEIRSVISKAKSLTGLVRSFLSSTAVGLAIVLGALFVSLLVEMR